jgi:HAMP domain-containing protein
MSHYQRTRRRLALSANVANLCGAALTIFYFSNLQDAGSTAQHSALSPAGWGFTVLITVGLFIMSYVLPARRFRPLWKWYRQATEQATPPPVTPTIRRLALELPLNTGATSLVLWLLAGLVFGVLTNIDLAARSLDWAGFWTVLLGTAGMAGPTTAIIASFATERAWQQELALFFQDADPAQTPALRLTVRRRLAIFFVLGTMPLLQLAILAYDRARQIAYAPQPVSLLPGLLTLTLFLVGVGITVAVALAQTSGTSLVRPLEALTQRMAAVQAGSLEEQVPVTSGDEIGTLTAHFNRMVTALKRRADELEAIYQVSQEITANLELEQTLQVVLEKVRQIIAYDRAEIFLHDTQRDILQRRAIVGPAGFAAEENGLVRPPETTGHDQLVAQRRGLLVPDLDAPGAAQPTEREIAADVLAHSYLGVPLLLGPQLVGTLELTSTSREAFDEHAQQLLETIAPPAAIAIQNAVAVLQRERQLKEEIAQLRIEIDEAKRARQVAEITETDYFQELQQKARQIRRSSKPKDDT